MAERPVVDVVREERNGATLYWIARRRTEGAPESVLVPALSLDELRALHERLGALVVETPVAEPLYVDDRVEVRVQWSEFRGMRGTVDRRLADGGVMVRLDGDLWPIRFGAVELRRIEPKGGS